MIVPSAGYHGSITGPIKNALDLFEDMTRDDRPYLDGCAFGSIDGHPAGGHVGRTTQGQPISPDLFFAACCNG